MRTGDQSCACTYTTICVGVDRNDWDLEIFSFVKVALEIRKRMCYIICIERSERKGEI